MAQQNPTPERAPAIWEKAFLKALSRTGVVSDACKATRIDRSTVYDRRKADEVFAGLWDEAKREAADWLEKEAWDRAVKGWLEPVYQQGKLVGKIRKKSDQLLIRLLEANNPEKFKRHTDITTGGDKLPGPVVYLPEVQDEA